MFSFNKESPLHSVTALIRSYALKAAHYNLSAAQSGVRHWSPTPNPAGKYYVELAMKNGEPTEVKKKKKKKKK